MNSIQPKLKAGLDADVATDLREGTEWACSKVLSRSRSNQLIIIIISSTKTSITQVPWLGTITKDCVVVVSLIFILPQSFTFLLKS